MYTREANNVTTNLYESLVKLLHFQVLVLDSLASFICIDYIAMK